MEVSLKCGTSVEMGELRFSAINAFLRQVRAEASTIGRNRADSASERMHNLLDKFDNITSYTRDNCETVQDKY